MRSRNTTAGSVPRDSQPRGGAVRGRSRRHRTGPGGPGPTRGLRGLADDLRENIVRSEVEGGLSLAALEEGSRVRVETMNRRYELEVKGGQTWISGHPEYCPQPVPVTVRGSGWGGSMLKVAYLGHGMQMEFSHPTHATVTTSRIVSIRVD